MKKTVLWGFGQPRILNYSHLRAVILCPACYLNVTVLLIRSPMLLLLLVCLYALVSKPERSLA